MVIGHLAFGLALKRVAPRTSIGTFVFGAYFLDLLWPILLLLGLEHVRIVPGITAVSPFDFVSYPITHSLLMAIVWSLLIGGIYRARTGRGVEAVWVGIAVVSHWFLDAIVHRPDLPLVPGVSKYVGLGLWNSLPGTLIVEGGMFVGAVALYFATTRSRNVAGPIGLWALIFVMVALYLTSLVEPPPPSARAVAWAALLLWLFVPWAYWIDRNREVRPAFAA